MPIDLVPFGFTPTESLVYTALISSGPTSAYLLSKTVGVARANVYQALNGLVTKGVASRVSDSPQVFRPIGPPALLAMVSEREAAKLDLLESQVEAHDQPGAETTFAFASERSFRELVLRSAVRASQVSCVATGAVLSGLNPIWRKRLADGAVTRLWHIGTSQQDVAIEPSGNVEHATVAKYFSANPVLLLTPDAAIVGREAEGEELQGYWSSDSLWIGAIQGVVDAITRA